MVSPDVALYNLHPVAIITLPIPLTILATIAISLRLWVRCSLVRAFGRDDIFLVLAYICFIAACGVFMAIGITEYNEGLGPIVKLAEFSVIGIALYLLNQCFFKLSLAFFFLRIVHQRCYRIIMICSVTISVLFNLALLVISIVQCGDIATINLDQLSCLDWNTIQGPLNYFGAGLNAAVDWIFAAISILVVRGLSLGTRSKLSVYGIVLLASAGSIVSIVRIPFIPGLRIDQMYYSQKNDIIAYTSLIEAAIGIIVASMAVLRPLGLKIMQRAKIALSSGPNSSPTPTPQPRAKRMAKRLSVKLFQAIPDPDDTYESLPMEPLSTPVDSLDTDLEKGHGSKITQEELPAP